SFQDQAVCADPHIIFDDHRRHVIRTQPMRSTSQPIIQGMTVVVEYLDLTGQVAMSSNCDRLGYADRGAIVDGRVIADDKTRSAWILEANHPGLAIANRDMIAEMNLAITKNERHRSIPGHIAPNRCAAVGHDLADILILEPAPHALARDALGLQNHSQ